MKRVATVLGAAIAFTSCGEPELETTADSPGVFTGETIVVTVDTLAGVVPIDGTVEARRKTTVSTRMMARVTSINVDVGSRVRTGQVLISLGTEDVEADRTKARAAVLAATAARDEAARNVARMDTLYAQDVVPMVRRDQARLALAIAESQLAGAQAAADQVVNAERYAAIRAPFDGAVVSRHIDPGDLAVPGMPLLQLTADGPREAIFRVPSQLSSYIQTGSVVTVDGGAFGVADARVRVVVSGADARSRTVEVRAELPPSWPTGVAVTVLVPNEVRAAITIPERTVVRRGQLTGVRVLTGNGVMLRWIRLGRHVELPAADGVMETRVEVLSGLQVGERILP